MAEISRSALFGKLDALAYKALEGATVFCKLRGNPYVELVHWVQQILQQADSDLHRLVRRFEVNEAKLAADVTAALDRLPRGATSISDLSPHLDDVVQQGWMYASLMFRENKVRTGHLFLAIVKTPELRRILNGISREFEKFKAEPLTEELGAMVAGSPEDQQVASDGSVQAAPGESSGAIAPAAMGKQEALARFSVDLTEKARGGHLDPILGRDAEIRQVIDILMRRRQNNPILTGEAGVGKTAVVEGFAQRIAGGDVPPPLKNVVVRTLDLGLLQAGASMKGEFEQRLRQVIEEVQASPRPIILFIDEAHTLIGAGGAAGQGDAANLLKPALARGTLRTIAATTWAEYKKYIEKDPALTRRFQVVKVEEPLEAAALIMLRGLASVQEKHHRVQVLDEALEAAVRLSHRYIPSRQLPDKAVSLLDTACARVAVGQHAVPAMVENARRNLDALRTERDILGRETALGASHDARLRDVEEQIQSGESRLAVLEERWKAELERVKQILELRAKLRADGKEVDAAPAAEELGSQSGAAVPQSGKSSGDQASAGRRGTVGSSAPAKSAGDSATAVLDENGKEPAGISAEQRAQMLNELRDLQAKLAEFQGESPLILPSVDAQAVASVVADWTGIPVGRMVKNEIDSVLKLADTLEKRVVGQRHALDAIGKRIRTSRAALDNPSRPVGVFLLVGPSGVGKTETALSLAESLYGGEQNLITINMSEFQEAHTVSTLKGSPPGYVGYGEGGVLTEAVRRRPYSVVLLDEVEKAHSDVHELFFQVFDKGRMEDGEGREIDFKNTIILLTSNVGSELVMNLCKDPSLMPDADGIAKALRPALLKVFPAALLGRLIVVPYYPISDEMLRSIITLQLGRIGKRLLENHKVPFTWDDSVVKLVASRCSESESGARAVDAILTHTVLPEISREFLERLVQGKAVSRVHLGEGNGQIAFSFQ